MTKQFLNRADVVTGLEEVRRDEWRNVCGVAGFAMYELRSASRTRFMASFLRASARRAGYLQR
jgi:hypothetical protein